MQPEVYWTRSSEHAPNSRLPILVYRNAVPADSDSRTILDLLQGNGWVKGGTWGPVARPHYHSNTHECYAPIAGWSRCLYGVGPRDDPDDGVRFELRTGDVVVHAAGVEHCNLESSHDYRYLALYPEGAPRWDSVYGELHGEEKLRKKETARRCPIPEMDPVVGADGPLQRLWRDADGMK